MIFDFQLHVLLMASTKEKLENQSKNMEENLKKNAKTSKDAKEAGQSTVYVIN